MRLTLAALLSAIALASALPAQEQTPGKDYSLDPNLEQPGQDDLGLVVVEGPGCNYNCMGDVCVPCKEDEACAGGCNTDQVCLFMTYRIFPDYALDCVEKNDARCTDNNDDKLYCAEKPKNGTAFNFGHTPSTLPDWGKIVGA